MQKIITLIIATSFPVLLQAQITTTQSQQEVQQTVIKMFDALSNRDSLSLKLHCTNDVQFFEYGMVWNIDTLIKKAIVLNTATDFKRINTFNFIKTEINNTAAWTTYYLHSEINSNGRQRNVQWTETVVLVKDKKKWKIKLLHSSLIKKD